MLIVFVDAVAWSVKDHIYRVVLTQIQTLAQETDFRATQAKAAP